MRLGIPRGFFYYDYMGFVNKLFEGTGIEIVTGAENNEEILARGREITVDEACLPVKLFVGQVDTICNKCDMVFIPRVMKDCNGRWLCPKLLGIPELTMGVSAAEKLLITEPLYFNNEGRTLRSIRRVFKSMDIKRYKLEENFREAYKQQLAISQGRAKAHMEAGWEFVPPEHGTDEIVLPYTRRVFLAGHCYNLYDKFVNCSIMKKLDALGIEALTEKDVPADARERAVDSLKLIKEPFWEAFIRIFGAAIHLRDKVDGIIYLSSFSCGPDAFTIEMLRTYAKGLPIMILKLDEHRGEAGFETRLEAFADLLERKRAS